MLNEMDKLRNMLDVNRIKYNYNVRPEGIKQIIVYDNGVEVVDIIYGSGIRGFRQGLLAIIGLLTEEELECDDIVGYLTAENVYNRIKKYFNEVETKGEKQC